MQKFEGLELWNKVFKTDKRMLKNVSSGGRRFQAIDGYYQIKNATELWGPYGSSWGLRGIEHELKELPQDQILVISKACFFYPGGEYCSTTSGWLASIVKRGQPSQYVKYDADIFKKNETSLLSKALSKVGFNADVFLGYFDGNAYAAEMVEEQSIEDILQELQDAKDRDDLESIYRKNESLVVKHKTLLEAFKTRNSELS